MASSKKQRKAANQARKTRRPQTGAFRHADGDRRRREEMTAAVKGLRHLRKLQKSADAGGEEE
jgi:hypothetical protein